MRQTQCLHEGGCAGFLNMVGRTPSGHWKTPSNPNTEEGITCYSVDAECAPKVHGKLLGAVGMEPGRNGANGKEWDHSRDNGTSTNALLCPPDFLVMALPSSAKMLHQKEWDNLPQIKSSRVVGPNKPLPSLS